MDSDADKPAVTVVIPCYQQADFLSDAIESVLGQTFQGWEIIVASGCPESATVTRRMIDSHGHPRIRLLENASRGVADARNLAIEEARGALILPLDADDVIVPRFLERAVQAVDPAQRYSIISTSLQEFGERRGAWDLPPYSPPGLLASNCLCVASLFTKALWRAAGGYDVALPIGYEDWSFWIACSLLEPQVVQIPERLLLYRVHARSSTSRTAVYDAYMRAMICVAHGDRYPRERVLWAHTVIGDMPDDALQLVERRLAHFQEPNLFFFRGLVRERRGDGEGARADYSRALDRSRRFHWQAALLLAALAGSI